ncbi:MAG: hypothetical protein GY928_33680 [Colwellia sp.]|nr:hypothetical protein [Colwellia sp.]
MDETTAIFEFIEFVKEWGGAGWIPMLLFLYRVQIGDAFSKFVNTHTSLKIKRKEDDSKDKDAERLSLVGIIERLERDVASIKERNNNLDTRNDDLEAANSKLAISQNALELRNKALEKSNAALVESQKELSRKLDAEQKKSNKLLAEYAKLNRKYSELLTKYNELSDTIEKYKAAFGRHIDNAIKLPPEERKKFDDMAALFIEEIKDK